MRFYFMKRYPAIKDVQTRHSLNNRESFHLFFSDIDTTFIIKDEETFPEIIAHFLRFRALFAMFDVPEFYTEKEAVVLQILSREPWKSYIEVCWNLRKLNWIKLSAKKDRYENLKQERAFKKSFSIVFECPERKNNQYFFSDIKKFNHLLSNRFSQQICLYSFYLDTTDKNSLRVIGSCDDFILFNSLMAGETQVYFDETLSAIKYAIEAREQLIVNTSLRVELARKKEVHHLKEWKAFLDSRMAMDYFLNQPASAS